MIIEFEKYVISPGKLMRLWVADTEGIPGFSMKIEAESVAPANEANTTRALMKIQESFAKNATGRILTEEDFREDWKILVS